MGFGEGKKWNAYFIVKYIFKSQFNEIQCTLLVQQLPSPLYNIHGHNADIGIIGFSPE